MSANAFRGEVDASAIGKGLLLKFDLDDQARISSEIGDNWFTDLLVILDQIEIGLMGGTKALLVILNHGLRKKDGERVSVGQLDETPPPLKLVPLIRDAVCLSVRGETYEEFAAWLDEQRAKLENSENEARSEGAENPPAAGSLPSSSEPAAPPPVPELTQTSSGN